MVLEGRHYVCLAAQAVSAVIKKRTTNVSWNNENKRRSMMDSKVFTE